MNKYFKKLEEIFFNFFNLGVRKSFQKKKIKYWQIQLYQNLKSLYNRQGENIFNIYNKGKISSLSITLTNKKKKQAK